MHQKNNHCEKISQAISLSGRWPSLTCDDTFHITCDDTAHNSFWRSLATTTASPASPFQNIRKRPESERKKALLLEFLLVFCFLNFLVDVSSHATSSTATVNDRRSSFFLSSAVCNIGNHVWNEQAHANTVCNFLRTCNQIARPQKTACKKKMTLVLQSPKHRGASPIEQSTHPHERVYYSRANLGRIWDLSCKFRLSVRVCQRCQTSLHEGSEVHGRVEHVECIITWLEKTTHPCGQVNPLHHLNKFSLLLWTTYTDKYICACVCVNIFGFPSLRSSSWWSTNDQRIFLITYFDPSSVTHDKKPVLQWSSGIFNILQGNLWVLGKCIETLQRMEAFTRTLDSTKCVWHGHTWAIYLFAQPRLWGNTKF